MPKVTLTERRSLELAHNLADAQNYVALTDRQQEIIDRFSDIFAEARSTPYGDVRARFLSAAFDHLAQRYALKDSNRILPCYSATIGLEIAASYIRLHRTDGRAVGLIHPTFDTLAYIAARHSLDFVPIEDSSLCDLGGDGELDDSIGTLILTLPNNPTGLHLTREQFVSLVECCSRRRMLLVVDCCYRYYADEAFDYYEILASNDIDYLLVEDTGKLFPLLDIKLGVLNCNPHIFETINSIHSDYLLEVSKFSMAVIGEFFEAHSKVEKQAYLDLIEMNRSSAKERLGKLSVTPVGGNNINVQLLLLPDSIESTALCGELERKHLGVIDATKLFWADHTLGQRHIRIALSRNAEYFEQGLNILGNAILARLEEADK